MAYTIKDASHLTFQLVNPRPFEDVFEDVPGVRARLASRLNDPEVLFGSLSCCRKAWVPSGASPEPVGLGDNSGRSEESAQGPP